jgi:hypothetical protein
MIPSTLKLLKDKIDEIEQIKSGKIDPQNIMESTIIDELAKLNNIDSKKINQVIQLLSKKLGVSSTDVKKIMNKIMLNE